jgi:hypothetical protein
VAGQREPNRWFDFSSKAKAIDFAYVLGIPRDARCITICRQYEGDASDPIVWERAIVKRKHQGPGQRWYVLRAVRRLP